MVFKKQIIFGIILLQHVYTFSMYRANCTPFASVQRKKMKSVFYGLIDTAKVSIFVSIFTIVDKEVARKLALAKARGVKVKVIMDAASDRNGYGIKELLEEFKIPTLIYKTSCGINHNKYLIVDDKKSWISSMNFTNPAYDKNRESAVLIYSQPVATFFKTDFQEICKKIQEQVRLERLNKRKIEEELALEKQKHQERMRSWRAARRKV
ncbi:phospholipase D family protein [Candidatus Babeliales bacterium]|nr:phospholipase D family protein [Candidatus Babeliales bacterium]